MKRLRVYIISVSALLLTVSAQPQRPANHSKNRLEQRTYSTPTEAARALGAAYARNDLKAVAEILGDKAYQLVSSGDAVIDRHEASWFRSLYKEGHEIEPQGERNAVLSLGKDGQPYPIPLIKEGKRWRFDTTEGHEDLLSRRISRAELSALNVIVAYVEAQRTYYSRDWDGNGKREYAQHFASRPGKRDGLFWETAPGKGAGPLVELIETARQEGYRRRKEGESAVYRGYVYRILKSQGANARGGSQNYVVDGKMLKGFALVAFPTRYGASGIMTFLVNQEGLIYQKDCGSKTSELGMAMRQFNPDQSWTKGSGN